MNSSILDTVAHPYDSMGTLNWLLWQWDKDMETPLLILTTEGTGNGLVNRVRAQLSITRRGVRQSHGQLKIEFGFNHKVFPWETLKGMRYEAVAFIPFQTRRHRFRQIIGDFASPYFNDKAEV